MENDECSEVSAGGVNDSDHHVHVPLPERQATAVFGRIPLMT